MGLGTLLNGPITNGRYIFRESKVLLYYSSGKEAEMTCEFSEGRLILDGVGYDREWWS